MKGMTPKKAAQSHISAPAQPIFLHCLVRIDGTRWHISAARRKMGGNGILIKPDQCKNKAMYQFLHLHINHYDDS